MRYQLNTATAADGSFRSTARILVADADPDLCALLSRSLVQQGYQVELAEDGVRVMERIQRETFDALLLDQRMPVMPGIEVLKQVRAEYDLSDLPVIMLTAIDDSELLATALRLGANDFVSKPSPIPVICARLDNQLRRSRKERSARNRDSLTGLATRREFSERLETALAAGTTSVTVLDLDWFKEINDRFGHSAGDHILKVIGVRLSESIAGRRCAWDCVARIGGDEFAVVLGACDELSAEAYADILLDQLTRACAVDKDTVVSPSVSIGFATGPVNGVRTAEELTVRADLAMHEAKRSGGRRVARFQNRMLETAQGRAALRSDLKNALEASQFQAVYLPEYALQTGPDGRIGRLLGFEFLLRWQHSQRGWIPPAKIIALAQEIGIVCEIGRWTIEQACRQLADWQRRFPPQHPGDPPLTVSVNLAPEQVADPRLVADVERILSESGVIPGTLSLEFTESSLLANSVLSRSVLSSLRSLKVGLKLDDFHSGEPPLRCLQMFPFDSLRIDRTLVNTLHSDDPEARQVIADLARIAKAMGVRVAAEGVESETQRRLAAELGCDSAQGFLLAKPMDPEAVDLFLHREFQECEEGVPVSGGTPS